MNIRKYLSNNRGNMSMALGVDLFATLLLVFLVSTAILLKTSTNDAAKQPKESERKTVDISLSKDSLEGHNVNKGKAVPVAARLVGTKGVVFFVGDKETTRDGVKEFLKQKSVDRVELRIDERLSNATTIQLLNSIQAAGVREVFYIFQKE